MQSGSIGDLILRGSSLTDTGRVTLLAPSAFNCSNDTLQQKSVESGSLLAAGMCAVAQLVATADSLHVCTGADAIPVLWVSIRRLILDLWRQQPGERVHCQSY